MHLVIPGEGLEDAEGLVFGLCNRVVEDIGHG